MEGKGITRNEARADQRAHLHIFNFDVYSVDCLT